MLCFRKSMILITQILFLCFSIVAFYIAYQKKDVPSFTFCTAVLGLFLTLLLTTHPVMNKVTTPALSIEPRLEKIETDQRELSRVVKNIVALWIISQDRTVTAGKTKEHRELEQRQIDGLREYLGPEFESTIQSLLPKELNRE